MTRPAFVAIEAEVVIKLVDDRNKITLAELADLVAVATGKNFPPGTILEWDYDADYLVDRMILRRRR